MVSKGRTRYHSKDAYLNKKLNTAWTLFAGNPVPLVLNLVQRSLWSCCILCSVLASLHDNTYKRYYDKLQRAPGKNLIGIQNEKELIRNLHPSHVNGRDRLAWKKGGRPWISWCLMMLSVLTKPLEAENDQQDWLIVSQRANLPYHSFYGYANPLHVK